MEKTVTVTISGLDLYAFMGIAKWEREYGVKFSRYGGQFMLEIAADCFEDVLDSPEPFPRGPDEVRTPSLGRLRIYNVPQHTVNMFRWAAKAHGCKVADAYRLFVQWVAGGWCRENLDEYRKVNSCYDTHESLIEAIVSQSQRFEARLKKDRKQSKECGEKACD